jgi:hypothetical protein
MQEQDNIQKAMSILANFVEINFTVCILMASVRMIIMNVFHVNQKEQGNTMKMVVLGDI